MTLLSEISFILFLSDPIKKTLETNGYKKFSVSGKNIWAKVFTDPKDPTKLLTGTVSEARRKCSRLVYKLR